MTERYQVNPTFNNIYWIWDYRTPMGKSLFYVKNKETAESICKYLNTMENHITEISKENIKIKQTIQDMMTSERTELGRSVLRQLWEQIQ